MGCPKLLLFAVLFIEVSRVFSSESISRDGIGPALFLTPFIKNGSIEEAKILASVEHPEMMDTKSYAGYLTIDENYDSNTFFWFFPARKNPESAPVAVWLQGGPGVTSMFGLFIEHGPYSIDSNVTLKKREDTWIDTVNVVYLDNPVGTGYSFTKNVAGYATSETQIGEHLLEAVMQFFELFPELANNDFFVAGESYAGKYVPALGKIIDEHNDDTDETRINVKGLIIVSGFTDPINQMIFSDYFYEEGLIDREGRSQFRLFEEEMRRYIRNNEFRKAYDAYDSLMGGSQAPSLAEKLTGYQSYYNVLRTVDDPRNDRIDQWIQREDVRCALHVGDNPFHFASGTVARGLTDSFMTSMASTFGELTKKYRILLLGGQLDGALPYTTTENFPYNLEWPRSEEWKTATRKVWCVDKELAGYSKSVDTLTDVLVRAAGHGAFPEQPKWATELVTRWMRNEPLDEC